MFVAMNRHQELVTLTSHEQAAALRGDFVCPACRRAVRVKNGAVVPAHFAHVGPPCAATSDPESAVHLDGKQWLAALGQALGYDVTLETYYPAIHQRADVVWQRPQGPLIIEFQCSPLSSRRLAARTAGYQKLHLPVVWVLGPPYHTRKLGPRQLKFMTPDLGVWLGASHQGLTHWQLTAAGYRVTRISPHRQTSWIQGFGDNAIKQALAIQTNLRYRERGVLALQALAYQAGYHLAGVPRIVHQQPTHLPGLRQPEWQVRTRWLLAFQHRAIDDQNDAKWWLAMVDPARIPLMSPQKVAARIRARFMQLFAQQQLLRRVAGGYTWQKPLVWYPDLTQKLAAAPAAQNKKTR